MLCCLLIEGQAAGTLLVKQQAAVRRGAEGAVSRQHRNAAMMRWHGANA
jgi:hypothetical protein